MEAEQIDAPPAKEETLSRQAGMSKWMAGLKESLPNPSLGQGNEPPTDPQNQPPADPPPAPDDLPKAEGVPEVPKPGAVEPDAKKAEPVKEPPADETRWPRSAKEWKNFTEKQKAKTEEFQKQLTERETRIKELEAKATATITPEVQKEIDTLKKENDEYSKQLRLLSVTNHPKFKNYFESKTATTLAGLKSCVGPDQLEAVTRLIQQPDSDTKNQQIEALLEDMSALQRSRLLNVVNGLESIQAEREAEVARAQQDYEQIVAQAKSQREAQQANFTKLLDDTVKGMQAAQNGRPEYQLREGETEWNASVQKRIEAGKKLITGNFPPEVMFKAAFDAAAYPDVLAGYKSVIEENEKLKKQIAAMGAANPTVLSAKRAETNGTAAEPALPKDARPMDYTASWVKKFGTALRGE